MPFPPKRIALFVFAAALTSCGGDSEPTAPPNKTTTVPFADLDWKDDVFLLGGKPFSGIATSFHKDGKTRKTEIGLTDGLYHGVVREWWENGNLQTETGFENGKRHGKNTYWDKDGKLIKEQVYDMDTVAEEKLYQ